MGSAQSPLALAERHVREGEARLARHERLIAELERDNHPERAEAGRHILTNLRWTLELSREHLERLRSAAGWATDTWASRKASSATSDSAFK